MSGMSRITAVGNLTRDPEMKYTQSGTGVCNFGIAINKKWKDKNTGELREDVAFIDVEMWGKQAEFASGNLSKGNIIFIDGELKMDRWEDKQSGQPRTKLKIRASRFDQIMPYKSNKGDTQAPREVSTKKKPDTDVEDPGEDIPF